MSDLTAKFTALEGQLADQQTALLAELDVLNTNIGGIGDAITVLNNQMQSGLRDMLTAMGQSAACFPCPTPSIVVPPLDTTVRAINSDKCKRSQAIIAAIHSILVAFDTMQSFNVIGTFNVVNDAISEVIGAIAAGDTIPLPSFPEAVQIVGTYISYAGERVFTGDSLISLFSPLEASLRDPIYNATTAAAARTAYDAVIDASSVSNTAKFLFKAVPYDALWSYYLDPASAPDLSAFSGTVCGLAPGTCFTLTSVAYTSDVPSSGVSIQANFAGFTPGTTLVTTSGTFHFTPAMIYDGDLFGWHWKVTSGSGVNCQYRAGNHSSATSLTNEGPHNAGVTTFPFTAHTGMFLFFAGSGPFTIELCAP